MKKQCFVLTVFVLLISSLSISAQASEKERVLKECEALFGKAIDKKLNLFEVNKDFVLGVKFDNDNLTRLSVVPKYFWNKEHSEWKEPVERPWLLHADYAEIITKLESIKPKGRLVRKGNIGICSNSYCWYQDYYEGAFLEYSMYPDVVGPFFVSFFQNVTGEVYFKKEIKPSKYERTIGNENIFRVHVSGKDGDGGHIYYVRKKVYKALKRGKVQTFQGAFVN